MGLVQYMSTIWNYRIVRTNTRFQPNTLSIARKCPCMLSTLFMDS